MAEAVSRFYDGGRVSCLTDSMSFAGSEESLRQRLGGGFQVWIDALAAVAEETGVSPEDACAAGLDVVIRIQGSLVYARATGDSEPFRDILRRLPRIVLSM